jgi:hypothetical protein
LSSSLIAPALEQLQDLPAADRLALAGARSFTEIGEWAADAPPRVLAALGVRYDPLARVFQPPDESTFRRVLEAVDTAALEAAVGSWQAARLHASRLPPGRRAVAVDGKAVRGTRHARGDGQAVHLLAAADPQAGGKNGYWPRVWAARGLLHAWTTAQRRRSSRPPPTTRGGYERWPPRQLPAIASGTHSPPPQGYATTKCHEYEPPPNGQS